MVYRIQPQMAVQAYKTYALSQPQRSHFRPATCQEAGCLNYHNGWKLRVEGQPERMIHVAKNSGRKWVEQAVSDTEHYLVFEAGQPCFAARSHVVPREIEPIYSIRGGDWRGTTALRRTMSAAGWLDDFGEHQQRIADQIERG